MSMWHKNESWTKKFNDEVAFLSGLKQYADDYAADASAGNDGILLAQATSVYATLTTAQADLDKWSGAGIRLENTHTSTANERADFIMLDKQKARLRAQFTATDTAGTYLALAESYAKLTVAQENFYIPASDYSHLRLS